MVSAPDIVPEPLPAMVTTELPPDETFSPLPMPVTPPFKRSVVPLATLNVGVLAQKVLVVSGVTALNDTEPLMLNTELLL